MTEQRLIDANALIDKTDDRYSLGEIGRRERDDIVNALEYAPTIEERKKGKWIKISPAGIYECSVCGQNVMTQDIDVYLYCHGCGAVMRGTP